MSIIADYSTYNRPAQLRVWKCVPLPHLNYLQGHKMEMPCPLMVINQILHPSEIGKNCCEMWIRNEACPNKLLKKSGDRSKPKVVLA